MKKNIIYINFIILFALISFTSCSTRMIDFTVISSKNVSLKFDKSQGRQTKGTSLGFYGIGASIKDAMDKALKSAGPEFDLLIDGVVRYDSYFLVFGYSVEGTAVSSSKLKAALGQKGYEEWCKENNVFDPNKNNN
jgi:hypothetical protein